MDFKFDLSFAASRTSSSFASLQRVQNATAPRTYHFGYWSPEGPLRPIFRYFGELGKNVSVEVMEGLVLFMEGLDLGVD